MHCFKCNSAQHFVHDCNDSRNKINTIMESDQINFILFNVDAHYWNVINDSNIKMSKLVREAHGMAVLDSACSQIVARKLWFDIFFDTLNDQDKHLVKTAKTNKTFCFGDGVEVKLLN